MPRFRLRTLMIAVAMVAVYAAIMRMDAGIAITVTVLTAGPVLRVLWHVEKCSQAGGPVYIATTLEVFAVAFVVNFFVVFVLLMFVPIL